ncbi:hypothetical protein QAD02_014337 [Eretmocerus hayati]|uniref:Uncharacterized protein n=1 Tax=Eretmocerus hayati TaxID=131215 RepID=A0ACC2P4Q2_9HYME|nr:hypothetical protein QAD02_014337 [Eretmocerus hayati]
MQHRTVLEVLTGNRARKKETRGTVFCGHRDLTFRGLSGCTSGRESDVTTVGATQGGGGGGLVGAAGGFWLIWHLRPLRGVVCGTDLGLLTPSSVTEAEGAETQPLLTGAGALDGLSKPPLVSLVCAARISGAISAMSGSEFGAAVAPSEGLLMPALPSSDSGNRIWRKRRIDSRSQGNVPLAALIDLKQ